jgi:hypothetical protein
MDQAVQSVFDDMGELLLQLRSSSCVVTDTVIDNLSLLVQIEHDVRACLRPDKLRMIVDALYENPTDIQAALQLEQVTQQAWTRFCRPEVKQRHHIARGVAAALLMTTVLGKKLKVF